MSRFVSAGTDEEPTERDEAWQKAQQEIETRHRQKVEEGKQEGGKSLYETLQANKAAKQEAFEESARLKNQFRSLDEDEVEFLDSVLESTRAKEAEERKQTSLQLHAFRRQQEEAEKAANLEDASTTSEVVESWTAGPRKRKNGRENAIGGVKIRRTSTADKVVDASPTAPDTLKSQDAPAEERKDARKTTEPLVKSNESASSTNARTETSLGPKSPSPSATGLGLAAYSSDEDD